VVLYVVIHCPAKEESFVDLVHTYLYRLPSNNTRIRAVIINCIERLRVKLIAALTSKPATNLITHYLH